MSIFSSFDWNRMGPNGGAFSSWFGVIRQLNSKQISEFSRTRLAHFRILLDTHNALMCVDNQCLEAMFLSCLYRFEMTSN